MAKRTITSCWKQYEKMAEDYFAGKKPDEVLVKLDSLTERANKDEIGNALMTLFVKPYLNNISIPITVQFTTEMENGEVPRWLSRFDETTHRILIHPVAIVRFITECRASKITEADEAEFLHCRHKSFLIEIAKLPKLYILFLAVLQRVAYLLEIAHLEKRGGVVEVAEGESYHTLLWGFKELEQFARKQKGISIRAHYGISWYESDWITGR